MLGIILGHFFSGCYGSSAQPDVNTLVKPNQHLVLREALPSLAPAVMQDLVVFGDSLATRAIIAMNTMESRVSVPIFWAGNSGTIRISIVGCIATMRRVFFSPCTRRAGWNRSMLKKRSTVAAKSRPQYP
jgi:hypothetical protein